MAVTKEEAAISAAEALGANVVPFGPRPNAQEPDFMEFSPQERAKLRRMMRQFDKIVVACPTARREAGE